MRITICDYNAGNLFSLRRALDAPEESDVRIETDPTKLFEKTDVLVLPGVGAFGYAMKRMAPARDSVAKWAAKGFPIIGICLGMQLLFEKSEESVGIEGLCVLEGDVRKMRSPRVPQLGWNSVEVRNSERVAPTDDYFYFANSYVCEPKSVNATWATTTYETDTFSSVVGVQNVVGLQFHPEKSSKGGVKLLNSLIADLVTRAQQ